jgi:hypothetical protein
VVSSCWSKMWAAGAGATGISQGMTGLVPESLQGQARCDSNTALKNSDFTPPRSGAAAAKRKLVS